MSQEAQAHVVTTLTHWLRSRSKLEGKSCN
jgi:hypothetical protein